MDEKLMDLKISELIKMAEEMPALKATIENQQKEIDRLNQLPGFKTLLSVQDVQDELTLNSLRTIRQIMNEVGTVRCGGKIFIMREDFREYLLNRKNLSDNDLADRVTDYEIKRAKKLANVQ